MNLIKFLLLYSLSTAVVFACDEIGTTRFINNDGSQGGLVGPNAKVNANAYIGFNAKVCEKAWVDAGAKILDQAIVKGNTWIREYSIVKEDAQIFENAILWGTRNDPVLVSGNSRVYGKARVLTGTNISGSSKVFGEVSLKDSKLSGEAKVCENFKLSNQNIFDDYFCSESDVFSKAELILTSHDLKKFNPKKGFIKLKSQGYKLAKDPQVFSVILNNEHIDSGSLTVFRDELLIQTDLEIDGVNVLQVIGRDEYGKKVVSDELHFVVGSSNETIQILDVGLTEKINFKVEYELNGSLYAGNAKYTNGILTLYSVPDIENIKTSLRGVSSQYLIVEDYDKISELPLEISAYNLPVFINNETDFEAGLGSWQKSHPENVMTPNENGKTIVEIVGLESERVEISKRFRLEEGVAGLSTSFILPTIANVFKDESPRVQIILASLKDSNVISYSIDVSNPSNLKRNFSIVNNVGYGEFVVLVRIEPSLAVAKSWTATKMISAAHPDVIVSFEPYHINPLNRLLTSITPTDGSVPYTCADPSFELATNPGISLREEPKFDFLSVGPVWDMGAALPYNRIHGTLAVNGRFRNLIHSISLVGVQDDAEKFSLPLTDCALEKFNSANFTFVNYPKNTNLMGHLFKLPLNSALVDTSNGKKIIIAAKVVIKDREENQTCESGCFPSISNETELDLLVTPQIGQSRWYSLVDLYDDGRAGILRTGGDKWIVPAYSTAIRDILASNGTWNVNDLSKANGGVFPGHDSHKGGIDADLQYDKSLSPNFNFSKFTTALDWETALNRIEVFLKNIESSFNIIDTVFITKEQHETKTKKNIWGQPFPRRWVDSKFQYRCFGEDVTRYIDLDEYGTRSLLTHILDHFDHLHLRFYPATSSGAPWIREPIKPNEFDLDDVWFEFNEDGELIVTPKSPGSSSFEFINIMWRYQDIEGFNNPEAEVQYGKWTKAGTKVRKQFRNRPKIVVDDKKFLYVTFANVANGGCVERKVTVTSTTSKSVRLTYSKKAKKLVYDGN